MIGGGSGWFTVRAPKRVGDTGTVYAIDHQSGGHALHESRIRKENLRNVKPILGRPDNPLLPGTVDAVFLLKTYHEVAQPIVLLRHLRASLSPGPRWERLIVMGIARTVALPGHRDSGGNAVGSQVLEQNDFVKDGMDYFLVFGAK